MLNVHPGSAARTFLWLRCRRLCLSWVRCVTAMHCGSSVRWVPAASRLVSGALLRPVIGIITAEAHARPWT